MRIVEILSAALTPILAILAGYIAWKQWRTEHLKLRHELYDRRLAVYVATMEFLSQILRNAKATDEERRDFLHRTRESLFLFDDDLAEYLDSLYKKSIDLRSHETMLHGSGSSLPIGPERTKMAEANGALLKWFSDQFAETKQRFSRSMRLS